MKPWEKYQGQPQASGPWAKYASQAPSPEGSGILDTMSNAADKITSTIPAVAGLMSPTLGMAQYAGEKINEASGQLGGAVTDYAGEHGVPGVGAAVLGAGASMFSNPMTYVNPGAGMAGRILKPEAPIGRQAAVSAAERIGMPMRRGEVTAGKASTGLSNFMEKTVMGSGPEDAFTARQYAALGAEKQRLTTPTDPYAAGQKAQAKIGQRDASMASTKNAMFDQIPDNVNIPMNKARSVADTIIQEQSQYLPTTRNSDIIAFSKDIQNAETSSGKGVTGGPEYRGHTEQIPGKTIPPSTIQRRSSLLNESGNPLAYEETIPGRDIPAKTEYGIKASVSPEEQFGSKSNYQQLKRLREVLGGKAEEAKNAGRYTEARDYQRLKHSIDDDINSYVSGQTSPVGSLIADEFSKSYKKANAFSGAYKGLYKSDEINALVNAPPEKIIGMVFKGKNNETAIKQFRAAAGEEGFLPVKQKFTQDLIDSNNVTKELEKFEEGTLRSIYSAQELKELQDYGLAQSIPKTSPQMQGTQGSSRSNIAAGQYTGLGAGILSLLTGNVLGAAAGIGQFVAPAAISRLNLHYAAGIPASFGRGSMQATKLGFTGGNLEESRKSAYASFIDKITSRDNP